MKKLLINAVSTKVGGGVNDLVHTLPLLDQRLRAGGWAVHSWVVQPGWQALRDAGYPLNGVTRVDVAAPHKRAAWEFARFPRTVRREQPDVVFQFSNFIFRDLPVPQITVLRNVAYFSDDYRAMARAGLYQRWRFSLGCRLSRQTIQRAAAVYCISHTQRQSILRRFGALGERVEVAYPGVSCPAEAQRWRGATRQEILANLPESLRRALDPATGCRPIVLNVAHNYAQKNLGDLLRAVECLRQRIPDVLLVMTAGLTGGEAAGEDARRARKLAAEDTLIDLGPVAKPHVWPLLALADVFAFPSSVESFGHPLLEAMSMGTPVVASDTPVHREVCGDAARFHRTGSPEDLAARLAEVVEQTVDPRALVEKGIARTSKFTWDNHVDVLCGGILGAAERGRRRCLQASTPSAGGAAPLSRQPILERFTR